MQYETVFGMTRDRERIAGDLIREELANRRMKQADLERELSMSRSNVSKALRGEMSLMTQRAIELDAFNWPIGFLRDVLNGDLRRIERYEVTEDFREAIKEYAITELRRYEMLVPVEDEGEDEQRSNGR